MAFVALSIYTACVAMDLIHDDYHFSVPRSEIEKKISDSEKELSALKQVKSNSAKRKKLILQIEAYKELLRIQN